MTLNLTAIRELAVRAKEMAEKATEGPWEAHHRLPGHHHPSTWEVIGITDASLLQPDATFIASSRTTVPELADAVLGLLEENERLREQRPSILQDAFKARDKAIAENDELRAACRGLGKTNEDMWQVLEKAKVTHKERDALKAENAKLQSHFDNCNADKIVTLKLENAKLKSEIEGLIRAQV